MKATRILFQIIASTLAVVLTVLCIAIAVPIVLVVYLLVPDPTQPQIHLPSKPWGKPDPKPAPSQERGLKSGQE